MENEKQEKKCCTKVWLVITFILALFAATLSTYMGLKIGVFDPRSPINQQPLVNISISKKFAKKLTYAKAQETGKPMVVLFYADWCKFCKMLAPDFNKVTKKKAFKENFAAAYVNCDVPENQDLVKEYDIHAFPTVYIVRPDGNKKQIDVQLFHEKEAVDILKSLL
ncbi:thioredoxin fold domain-containing protein [bacterium]|nr:thioredoxin fold domain-containing protein [bacterium]